MVLEAKLLATYEYLNKQKGGIMAFILGVGIFACVIAMLMWLGGEFSMYSNLPSLIAVLPPALAFGLAATSAQSMKLCLKLLVSEQAVEDKRAIASARRFATVTGKSALLLGVLATIVGFIAMASNIEPETFSHVIGPAFAVSLLTLLYGLMIFLLCYVAAQKIDNDYTEQVPQKN